MKLQKANTTLSELKPNVIKDIDGLKAVQVYELGTPSMVTYKRNQGKKVVVQMLIMMLVRLEQQLNVTNKTNDLAIESLASDLYDIGYTLTFEEIVYFFKEYRKGVYGEVFNSLSPVKVCNALKDFIHNKQLHYANSSMGNHNQGKERDDNRVNEHEEFKKISRQYLKQHLKDKK